MTEQFQPQPNQPDASFTSLYSPLGRILPPLRHHARGEFSSLHTVEDYFGAQLSPKMVDVASRLSERQLNEIEWLMESEARRTNNSLEVDRQGSAEDLLEFKSFWRTREQRQTDKMLGGSMRKVAKILSGSDWAQRPHIYRADEISTHEDMLPIAAPRDIGDINVLKHLALYCQHTAIRDPLQQNRVLHRRQDGANQTMTEEDPLSITARQRRFANGLRQLLPIAPLVRDGTFILVADHTDEDDIFTHSFEKSDPFLSWIISRRRPEILHEIAQLTEAYKDLYGDRAQRDQLKQRMRVLETQAQAVVREHYPYSVSDPEWNRLMTMTRWMHRYSLAPVTSDPVIARHLAQVARIELGGRPDVYGQFQAASPIATAASYQVPSLSGTQFSQIARLRESGLFNDIREGLVQIADICSQSAPQDYESYQRTVGECAQDIVGGFYAEAEKQRRRNRLAKLGIAATGEVLDMQINGIAGKLVGSAFKRIGGKRPKQRYEEADIACGILKSILLYK